VNFIMSLFSKIDMTEVTRLTREGRLKEAMAALKGGVAQAGGAPRHNPMQGAQRQVEDVLRGLSGGLGGLTGSLPGGGAAAQRTVAIPDGARFEERTFSNAAGSRPYKLYIPSTHQGGARPLIVLLHGCTQSPDDFAAGTRMNDLAEELGFLVAYPGQTKAANPSKCWNWFNPADQQRDRGEPALIAGITREIMAEHGVAKGQVFIAGLSAGGAAAAVMAAAYPDLYAGVGVHSGLACGAARDLPSALSAMKSGAAGSSRRGSTTRVPTIVFHGDRDTTVAPINGQQVIDGHAAASDATTRVDQGQSAGGMRYTRTAHLDRTGRVLMEHWALHGAGHSWSGGSPEGSYTDPRGPDASREMMRFFLDSSATAA
jgi:poly(hydroxyalkanoate) depolymerase family esterase